MEAAPVDEDNAIEEELMDAKEKRPSSDVEDKKAASASDPLKQARRFNSFAKLVYLTVVVAFNVAFWVVAIRQYRRPAEEYLEEDGDDQKQDTEDQI